MRILRRALLPIWLVCLMLTASITPFVAASGSRSTPDFIVESFVLTDAGSINSNGVIVAEDGTHVVRIQVRNIGISAGQASIALFHQGTATSGEVLVDSTDLGVIAAGASSAVTVFSWDATLGADQLLKARVSAGPSTNEPNTGNNEFLRAVDVERYQNATVPPELVDIPQPSVGETSVVWSRILHDFNVSVLNTGVKPFSARYWLNGTGVADPTDTFSVQSVVSNIDPGSHANSSVPQVLGLDFDATSRSGNYDVIGEMQVIGFAGWERPIEFLNQTVVFSDYNFQVTPAQNIAVQPGQTARLTYAIENTGVAADSYSVNASGTRWWVTSISHSPETGTVSPNALVYVDVDVTVPADAASNHSDLITMVFGSVDGGFTKSVSTLVLAGESYKSDVQMDQDTKELTPGSPQTIQVKVVNDGNSPTSFTLDAGISTNPLNWDLSFSSTTTGTLFPQQSVNITLTVTPPIIKNPINSAEYNTAGDAMSVWAQASAVGGGIPAVNSTPVRILPVIIVDPGLPTENIEMTPAQVLEAQQGSGLDMMLGLDVEVRHNLRTELTETVNATLSLGPVVFESASTGGFNETNRWSLGLAPTLLPNLTLGDTAQPAPYLTIQGPADDYPVAGTLTVPVKATPTLGSAHTSANVIPSPVTQTLTITIPTVLGAIGHNGTVLDAMVGEETSFGIDLANVGNNMTSYRLVLNDQVPDGWDVSFSTSNIMPSTTVLNVPADVANHANNSTEHIVKFPMVVTTDPNAPANSVGNIGVDVFEVGTGVYITSFVVPVRVGEKVNASLSPPSQTVNLSIGETITTSVVISNDGNTPATFAVALDTTNAGEIDFTLMTPTIVEIGAGFESTVRVELKANSGALAAANYLATVLVTNADSDISLSANILGNISINNDMRFTAPASNAQFGVKPGEVFTVDYTLINRGNLVENIIIETSVEGGWTVTPANVPLQLGVNESTSGSFDVDVPALSDDDAMLSGEEYTVTMNVTNQTTRELLTTHVFRLSVDPMFEVEVEGWPSTMDFLPGTDRSWDVTVKNTGNTDVSVAVNYTILQAGLTVTSDDWQVSPGADSTLSIQRGETVDLEFSLRQNGAQPALTLKANLVVTLEPTDVNMQGSAEYITLLQMNRFFQPNEQLVAKNDDGDGEGYEIEYAHIPTGPEQAVAYELELCGATRLLNPSPIGDEYNWSFSIIDSNDAVQTLDLTAVCGSTSLGNRITLDTAQPYRVEIIDITVDSPVPPAVLPNDGWDLEFRLYHPDEHNNYTVYHDAVFRYRLDVYADPAIQSQGPENPEAFYEGQETTYSVIVKNYGTARADYITASLDCHGDVDILDQPGMLDVLNESAEHTFTWTVRPKVIDWWEVKKEITCDASLSSPMFLLDGEFSSGNDAKNDNSQGVGLGQETVYSWSPDLSIVFVACVVAGLLSIIFVRLSSQSEKWQLGGVYAGVLAFGFAFHLFNVQYYGPAVLLLCVAYLWRMTWKSSDEFRLIHEDYQRARKGTSTVYSDHFEALKDSRRQLTIILSIPVLGMLAIVLGLPPQLSTASNNLVAMAGYFFLTMFGVWYLLRRSDKMYGNLYGRMTDAEIRSIRIERDLADPARLLNDLADDGLDFTAILSEGTPSASSSGLDSEKQPATDLEFSSSTEVENDD